MSEVKILLCDDDPDLLGLLQRRLKKMGIEPDSAGDGREAMGFVDEHDYDVIVTDIYMPEATGLEVMQYAKQKDKEVQVVIITSSATLENAIDALNHGAFGYLTKPFDHLIVFDNMVSRALEYRTLIIADKRKAEAQRRRGDMLEDEVEQRVKQLQKTQKGLLDLLGSLPDGVLVVEEGGKVVLSSPVGERWLGLDGKADDQPIHAFIAQVHAETPEPFQDVTVDGTDLHLIMADFPAEGELQRKAVIIREVDDDAAGAGSMVTETVMGIKKGLATLYEQGVGTEVVLNVASQFAVLEQLQGWSGGTGELKSADDASPAADPPAEPVQAEAPAEPLQAEAPAQDDSIANAVDEPLEPPEEPEVQADSPEIGSAEPSEITSVPPFTLPRERTPTGELDGPRLNTSELQEALMAATPASDEPAQDGIDPLEVPADPEAPKVNPAAETLIAKSDHPELQVDEPAPDPMEAQVDLGSVETDASISDEHLEEATVEIAAEVAPAESIEDASLVEANLDSFESQEDPVAEVLPEFEQNGEVLPEEAVIQTPPLEEGDFQEPDTQPTGVAIPPTVSEEAAPPWDDLEQLGTDSVSDSDLESFPKAESGTDDVPSWIDGMQGTTDPDLLQDFEFTPEESEERFPKDQTGNLEDDSMYKPRVIPEEMNARLGTPAELPRPNGNEEYAPPEHEGPITIQASDADTQVFRKVLEGLSGTQVLSGDYEKPPEEPAEDNGDIAVGSGGTDEGIFEDLEAEFGDPAAAPPVEEAPVSEPVEPEIPVPSAEELRSAQEPTPDPESEPVPAKPAQWPPTLPTEDDEWSDELDVSG